MDQVGAGDRDETRLRPPSLFLALSEVRAWQEFGASMAFAPLLMTAPRGDAHTVLVLPGFMASDASTRLLRAYLRMLGYNAVGWELGRNTGGFYRMRETLRARLTKLHERAGHKIALVGWSLGGVFARDLALALPNVVRSVITLGSPFASDISATNARRLYEEVTGEKPTDARPDDLRSLGGDLAAYLLEPESDDGVVHWKTSLTRENAHTENIEIAFASHLGLGGHPAALWAIADRLAQPEGKFAPFGRGGPFALAYLRREPK